MIKVYEHTYEFSYILKQKKKGKRNHKLHNALQRVLDSRYFYPNGLSYVVYWRNAIARVRIIY